MNFRGSLTVTSIEHLKSVLMRCGDSAVLGDVFITTLGLSQDALALYCCKKNADYANANLAFAGVFFKNEIYVTGGYNWFSPYSLPQLNEKVALYRMEIAREVEQRCDELTPSELEEHELPLAQRAARQILIGKTLGFDAKVSDDEAFDAFLGIRSVAQIAEWNVHENKEAYRWQKALALKAQEYIENGGVQDDAWNWCLNSVLDVKRDVLEIEFKLNRRKCKAPISKKTFMLILSEGNNAVIKIKDFLSETIGWTVMRHLYGNAADESSVLTLANITAIGG